MAGKLEGFSHHFSSSFSKSQKTAKDWAASYSNLLALPQSHSLPSRSISSTGFSQLKVYAKLGGGDEEVKKGKGTKKKTLRRDEEPEEYWQSAGEREGENPMKTPLPYIIIFGMSTPFVILAIAFANGWIKVPIR